MKAMHSKNLVKLISSTRLEWRSEKNISATYQSNKERLVPLSYQSHNSRISFYAKR